jgi:hypothetical protein
MQDLKFGKFSGFMLDLKDLRDPSHIATVEEVAQELHWVAAPTAASLLRAHQEDAARPRNMSALDVMQSLSLQKARAMFLAPVAPGQVFNAGNGQPLGKVEMPQGDVLMHKLEVERPSEDTVRKLEGALEVSRPGRRAMSNPEFAALCDQLAAKADSSESREFYKTLQATSLAK